MKVVELMEKEWKCHYLRGDNYVFIGERHTRDKPCNLNAKELKQLIECDDFKSLSRSGHDSWALIIGTNENE